MPGLRDLERFAQKHSLGDADKPRTRPEDPTQSLFGIVQGGMDRSSAEGIGRAHDRDWLSRATPSAGLAWASRANSLARSWSRRSSILPKDKPRYLMGVGTPEEIVEYAGLGVDMMDCVLPTRAARHGLLFTSEGKITIKQARYAEDRGPLDPNCALPGVPALLAGLFAALYASNEVLAQVLNTIHNLSFYLDTMKRVRHSISLGEESRFLSGIGLDRHVDLPGFKPES